jgi:hypothetical protein
MAKTRKTWREKLEVEKEPKLVDDPKGRGKMLIPAPLDVDALMRKVERGKLISDKQIRERLARNFNADLACPLATGIFIRIAAEAAEEDLINGREDITPYWRVIKPDGSLNPKFPGGAETQAARLREEGYTIEPGKGKKPPRVKDFEKSLQRL